MKIIVSDNKLESGRRAARDGAELIRRALKDRGGANIILATGASQFEMLDELTKATDLNWNQVAAFHLDEYAGLPISHPASFRLYLWKRFVSRLPVPPRSFAYIDAEGDLMGECRMLSQFVERHEIDVGFIGIGENGHLAFNDPPADFQTNEPYIVVNLDEACRKQQLGEGWFPTLDDVPKQAISMSVKQIMKSKAIICTVPDERKAKAVRDALEGPVTPDVPASILQTHPAATIYLDPPAASLLSKSDENKR
jgi:glucosamine-6-phosphate deaminase